MYKTKTSQSLHAASRELPLPLYVELCIHSLTRCKTLIEKKYQLGISVSYDHVIQIEEQLAKLLCKRYKEDGCVSPASLTKGIFTVNAFDNIDHNPSSTTSVPSFHGTAIPPSNITPLQGNVIVEDAKQQEADWLNHASSKLGSIDVSAKDAIVWAAYHSGNQQHTNYPPALTALLPLFYEKADSPAMIKHGMDVIREATSFLNPGQVPVITFDQPLSAIAKA